MSATRFKLEEARFFLKKLQHHQYDRLKANLRGRSRIRSDFEFYVSAFLSAARSVTWVMRAEYGALSGWESWFAGQVPSSDEDRELLRRFNDLRVKSEKVGLPTLGLLIHFVETSDAAVWPRDPKMPKFTMSIQAKGDDGGDSTYSGEIYSHDWVIEGFDHEPFTRVASRYFEMLETLVAACENEFVLPDSDGDEPS